MGTAKQYDEEFKKQAIKLIPPMIHLAVITLRCVTDTKRLTECNKQTR